tara:strand:+ start:4669 stop:5379 length:711 start_codon:yes stop_codon:yes gene_type:complete
MPHEPAYAQGRYWGKVTEQALGNSKDKGTPEIAIRFTIQGRVNPADPDPQAPLLACPINDRTVYLYITTKTADFVIRDLRNLGYRSDGFSALAPGSPNHESLVGKETEFICTHESYKGESRERWSVGFERKPLESKMDAKEMKQLDAMFGKAFKATPSTAMPAGSLEPTPTPQPPAPETEVDPPAEAAEEPVETPWSGEASPEPEAAPVSHEPLQGVPAGQTKRAVAAAPDDDIAF